MRKKFTSGQACHMTAPEMVELLTQQTWESAMGDLFKEASEKFKAQRKAIDNYHKAIAAEKRRRRGHRRQQSIKQKNC